MKMARPKKEQQWIVAMRDDLIWTLVDELGYDRNDVAFMFNVDKSAITRVMGRKPEFWQPTWKKLY